MKYYTSLRSESSRRIEQIESADIFVGIPCYNNESTIGHVIEMVSKGLHTHFKNHRCVIMVSDGGSTDDSRDIALAAPTMPWQEKIVTIYRGPSGKGTAIRSIFESASALDARACMIVDSDLRSITGDWVLHLIDPVLSRGYDYVSPIYTRYKYDGTITNNIVYNLTRALYGKRIRQPIGGDFAFSTKCFDFLVNQDVWNTDVAKFGIDIWMTISAIVNNFKICQSQLGVKVHDPKDPSESLAPMYRQVLSTIFKLTEDNESYWRKTKDSSPVEIFGADPGIEPEPLKVSLEKLVYSFKSGYRYFSILWEKIFSEETFGAIKRAYGMTEREFRIENEDWAKILYEIAATHHQWKNNRFKLVQLSTPLYFARVASFINATREMDSVEAEVEVEKTAQTFETLKEYFIMFWDKSATDSHEADPELDMI